MAKSAKVVHFKDFREGDIVLIEIDTVPVSMRSDYWIRNANLVKAKKLCKRCDGTGNELMRMHKSCKNCMGTGISHDK